MSAVRIQLMFYVQATHPGGSVWLGGIMEMLVLVRKGFGLWVFGGYTRESKACLSSGRSARGVREGVVECVFSGEWVGVRKGAREMWAWILPGLVFVQVQDLRIFQSFKLL